MTTPIAIVKMYVNLQRREQRVLANAVRKVSDRYRKARDELLSGLSDEARTGVLELCQAQLAYDAELKARLDQKLTKEEQLSFQTEPAPPRED